ncbi:serine/threonine-protein phosphatase [Radiobacillus kanasensis]|uniref:PP2C family protein-serine/threonine phosphatase n=1 Tax=Radiobacillus kanasensis TaxID=2844358 RepID=UPI001E61482F|nr:PP2C family serine/threonine-protein phosphatase [Radiobacillus kanasensis]UFT99200.1 serine/threonine-protein phosphatase [Radiobacillus kanasensis]
MAFITAYHTDVGVQKKTNQDALLIKTAKSSRGPIGLFVVCDGMGGLTHGELASATVIRSLSDWFEETLPSLISQDEFEDNMTEQLVHYIEQLNSKILSYGESKQVKLGTTVTAMLIIDSIYYLVQIGDSRAYAVTAQLVQLTKDQSLVAREVERGNITEAQAKVHPNRNVLLQCVGAKPDINVVVTKGSVEPGASYLLCTDGFYHEISMDEIIENLHPDHVSTQEQIKEKIHELINMVKQRKEVDNISVIVTKVV